MNDRLRYLCLFCLSNLLKHILVIMQDIHLNLSKNKWYIGQVYPLVRTLLTEVKFTSKYLTDSLWFESDMLFLFQYLAVLQSNIPTVHIYQSNIPTVHIYQSNIPGNYNVFCCLYLDKREFVLDLLVTVLCHQVSQHFLNKRSCGRELPLMDLFN